MKDVEMVAAWRSSFARAAVSIGLGRGIRGKFFGRFEQHFESALLSSGISREGLRIATAKEASGTPLSYEEEKIVGAMCNCLRDLIGELQSVLPPREFREGSGTTIKDGGHQDVVRVRPRRRSGR
jgi:hypothetical protein